ncbi:nuclear RNA export factor 3 isoform X3 [Mus musculus]|nr:nuclear RNA export factor 3 isoform X3 [Mus musculus]XP_006528597.2 nuclear RNA export factor 3 isoform X3 [Mus musculus]XP_011246042.1 nuclear RNA export factor 3 isoform X3 [Mus musculus]XP_036017856.1 nuclear RNA export factor 3 isoform X3 [Mus musculus]|eukprot:XP_006528595.2 PREDICTED: nuclear RNA export factor 3 isoform X2 [Mus musculus]
MRCRRIFQQRFLNSPAHVSDTVHTSFYQQPAMSNPPMHTRRYTPYGIPSRYQRVSVQKWNQTDVNMEGGSKPPERKMQRDKQDDTSENWFKVTIPFGIKYDKKWLLNLIQSQCSIPFTPVQFHYEKMQAHFFVDNPNIAFMLKAISDKILDETDNKISIFISPCDEPHSVTELKLEKMDHTMLTTNQQCATSQRVLNRQRLPFDQDLMTRPTDLALVPRRYMTPSLSIHKEDMTQVNSEGEVAKVHAPDLEKICADQSSLSTTMPDKSSNINSILELFPKLLSLDGQESHKPTLCGPEDHKTLSACKEIFFGSESIKTMVLQFLKQYYFIYDNGDRQGLLNAYHPEACFTLTIPFSSIDLSMNSLCEYFKFSRNMKILKDPYMRRQLLKHKKCDIIHFLRTLPKTQHDLTSFVVDICLQTEKMLCFSVSGLFKEVDNSAQGCMHAFTRIFVVTHDNSSELCIINDKLSVTNVHEVPSASTPVATSSTSYLPSFSQDQQEMVPTFCAQSGVNVDRSQKSLHDDQWNYNRAIQSLALLKVEDTISEDKFTQTDPRS